MDLILEGPEDDSIGVETCCTKNSNIIIKYVVFDWYSVIYIRKSYAEVTGKKKYISNSFLFLYSFLNWSTVI